MANEKNFVGNGREFTFNNGGSIINLSLNLEKLKSLPVSDKGYIRITVAEKKDGPDERNNTHNVYENDYKKEEKEF